MSNYNYGFNGTPVVEYLYGSNWKVVNSLVFRCFENELYEVPAGTATDGASARLFWGHVNLLPAPVQNNPAAWLHDHHYRTGWVYFEGKPTRRIDRKEADLIFKICLESFNMSPSVCRRAHMGLRLLAWSAWNTYRKHELKMIKQNFDRNFVKL